MRDERGHLEPPIPFTLLPKLPNLLHLCSGGSYLTPPLVEYFNSHALHCTHHTKCMASHKVLDVWFAICDHLCRQPLMNTLMCEGNGGVPLLACHVCHVAHGIPPWCSPQCTLSNVSKWSGCIHYLTLNSRLQGGRLGERRDCEFSSWEVWGHTWKFVLHHWYIYFSHATSIMISYNQMSGFSTCWLVGSLYKETS